MRFSQDKTPYKTHIAAAVGSGYVQLSADGLAAGDGMYGWRRTSWTGTGRRWPATGPALSWSRSSPQSRRPASACPARDTLKSAPRGYPADHLRIGLLRHKGLIAWQEWPAGAWLETTAAKDRVVTFLRTTRPLSDWLATEVGGASRAAERAR